jgi:hypothetical protein
MGTNVFDLKQLPPELAQAIVTAQPASELVIMDNQVQVARVIVGPVSQARVAGLHAGTIQVSDDFDAALPDDFWTGAP